MGVYHLGNNLEFHGDIYDLAIRTPGLLVIHDLALDDFVMGMVATAQPFGHQAHARGVAARAAPPRVRGGRAQRAAPRPVRRARGPERAGDRRALAVRRTLPARVRLQDADLRGPAPGDRERAARPEGGERRSRDPRVARVDGDGDADRRVRRPERRQADRRRPRGDGAPAAGRAPRAGRASHPRVRRRADGAGERARRSGVGAHRRLGRGLPRVDVRRGRRGRPPVPAPGRGLRFALAFDAGRRSRRS